MLKRSLFLLPKFSLWIVAWTLITWVLFYPTRVFTKMALGPLNLDYAILSPKTSEFHMVVLDAIRNNPTGYLSFIVLALISGFVSILFAIGILPALAQAITNHSKVGMKDIVKLVLKAWPDHVLPMLWRFMAWSVVAGLLMAGTAMTLFTIEFRIRIILYVLFVEWVVMLSWWTHTAVLWGHSERKCLRQGLVRLVKNLHITLVASCFWILCSGLAAGIHFVQLKSNLLQLWPMMISHFLFLFAFLLLHVGKFLWLGCHSLPAMERGFDSEQILDEPSIRRIFT